MCRCPQKTAWGDELNMVLSRLQNCTGWVSEGRSEASAEQVDANHRLSICSAPYYDMHDLRLSMLGDGESSLSQKNTQSVCLREAGDQQSCQALTMVVRRAPSQLRWDADVTILTMVFLELLHFTLPSSNVTSEAWMERRPVTVKRKQESEAVTQEPARRCSIHWLGRMAYMYKSRNIWLQWGRRCHGAGTSPVRC